MILDVVQEDFDLAVEQDKNVSYLRCNTCALAQALLRNGCAEPYVYSIDGYFYEGKGFVKFRLSDKAQSLVDDFDLFLNGQGECPPPQSVEILLLEAT